MQAYRWHHAVATLFALPPVAFLTATILEQLPNASLAMKCGVPLATIAAAMLPVLSEAAWRAGERFKACLMVLPVLALVAYELPSGISRFGEAQQARVTAATMSAEDAAKARVALSKADRLVSEAQAWVATECATGRGKKCDGVTYVLEQRQSHQAALSSKLATPAIEAPWLPTWHPALLPIGLWLVTLTGLFYGMGPLTHPVQALTFERDLTPAEIAEIKRIQRLTPENVKTLKGLGMKYHEIAGHFGINQGRISEMMAGKREAITLH